MPVDLSQTHAAQTNQIPLPGTLTPQVSYRVPLSPSPSMNGTTIGIDAGVMASYNDRDAGCLLGSCLVELKNGSIVTVESLVKGDIVLTSMNGSCGPTYGRVVCIVKSQVASGCMEVVRLSDHCVLTPWHPVRVPTRVQSLQSSNQSTTTISVTTDDVSISDRKWKFPATLNAPETILCQYVYSLLIESIPTNTDVHSMKYAQSVLVDGAYECIALAHGINDDDVAEHNFFGTTNIVKSLSLCPGFTDGVVTLLSGWCLRDSVSMRVIGIDIRMAVTDDSDMKSKDDGVATNTNIEISTGEMNRFVYL